MYISNLQCLLLTFLSMLTATTVFAEPQIFFHGKFHVMDKANTVADWVTVENGKILGFGRGKPPKVKGTRIDLGGKYIYPGLTDSHAHLMEIGEERFQVDLRGTKNAEEAAVRVATFITEQKVPEGETVVGNGWDQSEWPSKPNGIRFPDREDLDTKFPDRSIILFRIDGHAAWANTKALKKSGIWKTKKDPAGGKILRDSDDEPTGILLDTAMRPLGELTARLSDAVREKYVASAVNSALEMGITGAHDAGVERSTIEAIRRLLKAKKVHFRFYEMLLGRESPDFDKDLKQGPEYGSEDGQLTVRTVKLFADGAMGSRGAAFLEPYTDDPKNKGLLRLEPEELEILFRKIDAAGFQIAVHAIGDAANKEVIDTVEKVMGKSSKAKRPRLEHAQVLRESDFARVKKLGIIASMQPIHCTSDMKWVVERIGKKRAKFAYAWATMEKLGIPLAFGSDSPVDTMNPWYGLFAAVTRQDATFKPPKGFYPEQRISRENAFAAYTRGAAFASFAETSLGSLEKGKWADFIVLKKDLMRVSQKALGEMKVDATYVGGLQAWPPMS